MGVLGELLYVWVVKFIRTNVFHWESPNEWNDPKEKENKERSRRFDGIETKDKAHCV